MYNRKATFTKFSFVSAVFMLPRLYNDGLCKRKCWQMSASSAGIGLKYQKQMGARAMGAWGAWVTGAFIFQTNSGRGSTHLSAFSLTYTPTILAEVHENSWDKIILVKVASLVYNNSEKNVRKINIRNLKNIPFHKIYFLNFTPLIQKSKFFYLILVIKRLAFL